MFLNIDLFNDYSTFQLFTMGWPFSGIENHTTNRFP